MSEYQANPACRCGRCSTRGLMGPAVLVTLGILFLLSNTAAYPFERTWPILLIVIGLVRVARYVMPDHGHVNPGPYPYGYPPPPYQAPFAGPGAQAGGPVITPPPPPPAGQLGEGTNQNDEVNHG